MTTHTTYDVIIIGGSYSGLSAALALGRALRNILIIDSGKPCNAQTPYSHNFITQDGKTPSEISALAKQQVQKYTNIKFYDGLAISGVKTENGFDIKTQSNDIFSAKKLIFATGIKDIMPDIKGIAECWGISVLHCPYCHGYEVRQEKTAILGNGDYGFDFSRLISNWTKDLTLLTNGKVNLEKEQIEKLQKHNITIIEKEVKNVEHQQGQIEAVIFKDGSQIPIKAVYTKLPFAQHCEIPTQLGCELTEQGYIKVDAFQKTNIHGIYACGDNTTSLRSVSNAVAMGTLAGATLNREMIEDVF